MKFIIDRRLNPKGKSLANRQRFIRRAKREIREAVDKAVRKRSITDTKTGDKISIPSQGIKEPRFRHTNSGVRDIVLPGNKDFVTGDIIQKPPQQGGQGGGKEASDSGEGQDDFQFTLSRDEFLDIFFEDLSLPNMVKEKLKENVSFATVKAGFANDGSPSNISLVRTMRNSLARRIAFKRPKTDEIKEIEAEITEIEGKKRKSAADKARLEELQALLESKSKKVKQVPYIDPLDVRYHRFEKVPKPITQAVMFCVMDVSGSMSESMKEVAKRFFILLHLFLERRYKTVDIVFIRHTTRAEEVDEETFFYSRETGGTIVSTALEEMHKIIEDRYPVDSWNIYGAQASDGDNFSSDTENCVTLLQQEILPRCQYYAYLEISDEREREFAAARSADSTLWQAYARAGSGNPIFAMRKVNGKADVYPIFRDLFSSDKQAALAAR